MRKFTKSELDIILENHKHWISEDCDGWEDMRANLSGADLRDIDLGDADLTNVNLSGADLRNANLRYANLSYTDLSYADLSYADMENADLENADLSYANLRGAKNVPFVPYACPDTGSFIGYKKIRRYIVRLEILSDAKRCSATGRRCRCSKANVVSIQEIEGMKSISSVHDSNFAYTVGEVIEDPNFCEDRWEENVPGIHFYINKQEAINDY